MARPEFEGGVPNILEVNWNDREELNKLQTVYGQFAASVLLSVQNTDPDAPKDIVTFGSNWFQLTSQRANPLNDAELSIAAASQKLDPSMFGPAFFADMWQLMQRHPGYTVQHLLGELQQGVQAQAVDARILKRLAVLDLTKTSAILQESDFPGGEETPWGTNGVLPGTDTMIYHITCGYPRMMVQNLPGDDKSDMSGTYYGFGERTD